MANRQRVVLGGVNNPTPPIANANNGANTSKVQKFLAGNIGVFVALVLSLVSYYGVHYFLPPTLDWWLIEIACMLLTFLILGGLSAAMETKVDVGASVALFVFVIFSFQMLYGYVNHSQNNKYEDTCVSKVSVVTLEMGTNVFQLKHAGDRTPWLQFPLGKKIHYKMSSDHMNFEMVMRDGTVYGVYDKPPMLENPTFYIRSVTEAELIRIDINER